MNKWRNAALKAPPHCKGPVPIVSDAAVAIEGVGDGRFVPVLVVDSSKRLDIEDLVKFHDHIPSGDVKCTWGSNTLMKREKQPRDLTKVALFLEFERPSETFVNLEFDVIERGAVVDTILISKAFYLQPGRHGERFIHDLDKPKILVEVPDTGFKEFWDDLWHKSLVKKFKKTGLNRTSAIKAATETIEQIRSMSAYRMKQDD